MSSTLELYSFDACPYAQRTRMVLLEKGLDFRLVVIINHWHDKCCSLFWVVHRGPNAR